MRNARIDGTTFIRPARVAFIADIADIAAPSIDALRASVINATSVWGGVHGLMFPAGDPRQIASLASSLGVDFFYNADGSHDAAEVCKTPGFSWRGGGEWGPFGEPEENLLSRLLGPDRFLNRLESRTFELRWQPDDPLSDMLAIWFGSYGDSPFGIRLREKFETNAVMVDITSDGIIPDVTQPSPVALTGVGINYSGLPGFRGVVVLDPTDPSRLSHFWNLRALGGTVFPWPTSGGTRLSHALAEWLKRQRDAGTFSNWRRADGTPSPPRVEIDLPPEMEGIDAQLDGLIDSCGLSTFLSGGRPYLGGWNGSHPLNTEFSRSFSSALSESDTSVVVPLPDFAPGGRRELMPGMVVAQVEIHREHLDPDHWCVMPNIRELADKFMLQALAPMWRPIRNGRVVATQASEESIELPFVSPIAVFSVLFEGSGWTSEQSSNGRFSTRLIDTLGGTSSAIGNQPAIRDTLVDVRKSPVGKTVRQLEPAAQQSRGAWPDDLFSRSSPGEYANAVVRYLIERRLLRPHLRVRCPTCAVELSIRPEDLATNISCEMCSAEFALGTALTGRKGNSGWHYQLPPNVDDDRLRETLAIMAVTSVFDSRMTGLDLCQAFFGLLLEEPRVKGQPPGHKCDVDVIISLHDRGAPVLVIGEVKHHGSVDVKALLNLERVQSWLRSKGIECLILRGSLSDEITEAERVALRELCERAPRSLHGWQPVLPIVLNGPELSVPERHELHPHRWTGPGDYYASFAIESCKQNLGLVDVAPSYEPDRLWNFSWGNDTSYGASNWGPRPILSR